jgi:HNH endonuclease
MRIREYDTIGEVEFRKRYGGIHGPRSTFLVYDGQRYNLKALWASAHNPPIQTRSFNTREAISGVEQLGFHCEIVAERGEGHYNPHSDRENFADAIGQWHYPFRKADESLRKQYRIWSIPARLVEQLGIKDGIICRIRIRTNNISMLAAIRVTSGCEISLPKTTADQIANVARKHQSSGITFEILADFESVSRKFYTEVNQSLADTPSNRQLRLQSASRQPERKIVSSVVFARNPDVVAEVLTRANGYCEECNRFAPFLRRFDGTPYLEVHHLLPLAQGGEDAVENAIALCPNCHRKAHYG